MGNYEKGEYRKVSITGRKSRTYKGKPVMTREERRQKQIERSLKISKENRNLCLQFYGGNPPKCACCGETTYQFLAMDHINGGGNAHRRKVGVNLYIWLRREGFPKGFQVLCHNCNLAKGFYGICPHKVKELQSYHS